MELSPHDAGRHCTLQVGETVTFVLPENPTTGFRWQANVDSDAVEASDDHYDGAAEPRGAGGTRRLAFTAVRPGPARLHLVRKRAWEAAAVEEFEVSLDVLA